MQNEQLVSEAGKVEDMTPDYLEAIQTLKQNSVDRAEYDKLRAENKKLLSSIVNGSTVELPATEKEEPIEVLREKYLREDQTNLDYITNTLKLREALIKNGEPDPFLPIGSQILPTDEDIATANKVAEILQDCVDYAEGDSTVFTNELQRRLVDIKIR